jgi:hypothetical protein
MKSITHIFKVHRTENFKTICCDVFDDKRLSWKAKGLHTYLMSRPENWVLNRQHILSMSKDNKYSYDSGIQELKDLGYLRITKRGFTWTWEVFESLDRNPTIEKEIVATTTQLPSTQFPSTRKPSIQKPGTITRRIEQEGYKQEVVVADEILENPTATVLFNGQKQPINFWDVDKHAEDENGNYGREYEARIVRYWQHSMLVKHGIKLTLSDEEIVAKCEDLGDGELYFLEALDVKRYIDWFMSDYYAGKKKYYWNSLISDDFVKRFKKEENVLSVPEKHKQAVAAAV